MTLLIQITDTHILPPGEILHGEVDTTLHLAETVRQINRMNPLPDVVMITGDLVEHGDKAGYQHFLELIKPLKMPSYVLKICHLESWRLTVAPMEPSYRSLMSTGYPG